MAFPLATFGTRTRAAFGYSEASHGITGTAIRAAVLIAGMLLVTLAPPLVSGPALLGLAAAAVLLARPVLGLYALLFAVPFESVRSLTAGGLNVTVTNLVSFCLAVGWLGYCASKQRMVRSPSPWLPAVLIYGLIIAASVTQAHDLVLSAKEFLKWGQMLFAYLVGVTAMRSREDVRRLLIVLFIAVFAESAVGVAQAVLHSGPSSFARGGFLRASGTFDQPNPFAGYLNMTFPVAVALLVYRGFPRFPMWVMVLATGGGVLISLSRGAELASIAALCTMAAIALPKSRPLIAVAILAIFAVFAGAAIGLVPSAVTDSVAQQFGVANIDVANPSPDNWAVAERLAHMEAGLRMFADHPILGVGIGNYANAYPQYQVAAVWANALGHAHNYYINIAAEAGVPGFIGFLIFEGGALVVCATAYRRATLPFDKALALGGLGVIVGVAVHSFFDDIFVHSMEVQLALVMVMVSRVWADFAVSESVEQAD